MEDSEDKKYITSADVHMRLSESFIKYKNDFYYAKSLPSREFPRDTTLGLYSIQTRRQLLTIDANDKDLDTASLQLGYLVIDWGSSIFLTRLPTRRQKQGISPDNIFWTDPVTKNIRSVSESRLFTKYFKEMLSGVYLSYKDCLSTIRDGLEKKSGMSKPFDLNFSVVCSDDKVHLHYNTNVIGEIELKTGTVFLHDDYNHSVFTLRLAELGVSVA